jgi:Spy/CpxP family protein refolding chaperone
MKLKYWIINGTVMSALATGTAWAQDSQKDDRGPGNCLCGGGPGGAAFMADDTGDDRRLMKRDKMMETLNLSDEQKAKIKEIRLKYKDDLKSKKSLLAQKHDQMREQMLNDADDNTLLALHREISGLRSESADLHFKIMTEIRAVLTPEQRKSFAQMHHQGFRKGGKFPKGPKW